MYPGKLRRHYEKVHPDHEERTNEDTNVAEILVSCIKYSQFALQMDESTDIAGLSVLLVFVRYININSFKEDFLFCRPLLSNTTGVQIVS